jgi:hypothetical protein
VKIQRTLTFSWSIGVVEEMNVVKSVGCDGDDTSPRAGDVAVLAAWALGSVVVAARGVRWEPRLNLRVSGDSDHPEGGARRQR